jgi:hypothetical protein
VVGLDAVTIIGVLLGGSHGGIDSMAAVLIACPDTGGLVPTGADVLGLDDLEADNRLVECPECGNDHAWSARDAVLSSFAAEKMPA